MSGGVVDTHVWIWLVEGLRLSAAARDCLERAHAIEVPAISPWETALLGQRGRITLSSEPAAWLRHALAHPACAVSPLTDRVAWASVTLPGGFHGDPADRLIVATARELALPLLTRERKILAYAEAGHARAVAA